MKILLSSALLAASLLAAPASAQQPSSAPVTKAVGYADLDLASDSGRRQLDRRIRVAVENACGPTSDVDPAGKNFVRRCRDEAYEAASAQRSIAIAAARRGDSTQLASRR
jgi:UrcA family protein